MGLVADDADVLGPEAVDVAHRGIELEAGEGARLPVELTVRLLQVVEVERRRRCGRPGWRPVTRATIAVRRAYEAMLKGTPRKTSALR